MYKIGNTCYSNINVKKRRDKILYIVSGGIENFLDKDAPQFDSAEIEHN